MGISGYYCYSEHCNKGEQQMLMWRTSGGYLQHFLSADGQDFMTGLLRAQEAYVNQPTVVVH